MYSMILKFALRHLCGEGKMETSVKVETKGLVSFWMVHYMSLRYMTARGLCWEKSLGLKSVGKRTQRCNMDNKEW